MNGIPRAFVVSILTAVSIAFHTPAARGQTNLAVIVRHAPGLIGDGRIEGSLQQLLPEETALGGGFTLTGDLLLPGTPSLRINGRPELGGVRSGPGPASPGGYGLTLNGNCSINGIQTRTAPGGLTPVPQPGRCAGYRRVVFDGHSGSLGDPATVRDVYVQSGGGPVSLPPGRYGSLHSDGQRGFVLGVAGSIDPALYEVQSLELNGPGGLEVVGPVILILASGFEANGCVGSRDHPEWLQVQVAMGGVTLNGGCSFYGGVSAPSGTVNLCGHSELCGWARCDRLIMHGGCVIRCHGAANAAPIALAQSVAGPEDTPLPIRLTGTDREGAALKYAILSSPAHGSLSGTAPEVVYLPAKDFNGTDGFTFKVNDGRVDSAPAAVSIRVTPVNDAPVALGQSLSTPEDTGMEIQLSGTDADGDGLSVRVTKWPEHGVLSEVTARRSLAPPEGDEWARRSLAPPDGDEWARRSFAPPCSASRRSVWWYWPDTNYDGEDLIEFVVNDAQVDSAPAQVRIQVTAVDDAPVASSQSLTTDEDAPVAIVLQALDVEGDGLDYEIVQGPRHGVLIDDKGEDVWARQSLAPPDGDEWAPRSLAPPCLWYQPGTNYFGSDSFVFVAWDGWMESEPATVTVNILPVNDAPVVLAQVIELREDTATNLVLTGTDVEGDTLAFRVTRLPLHGTLSGEPPALVYSPAQDFAGTDTFEFEALDPQTNSFPATVTIVVEAVNDPPRLIVPAAQSVTAGAALEFGNSISIADPDAASGSMQLNLAVTNGVLEFESPASAAGMSGVGSSRELSGDLLSLNAALSGLRYRPAAGFSGSDTLVVTVSDLGNTGLGGALMDTQAVAIQVTRLPVAPTLEITRPVPGQEFGAGQGIFISLDMADRDALVERVRLMADGVALAEFSGAPFEFEWTNAAPGVHQLGAEADELDGGTVTAQTVPIVVRTEDAGGVAGGGDSEFRPPVRSSRGSDFWLMFLPNMQFPGEVAYVGCELIVSSDVAAAGTVTVVEDRFGEREVFPFEVPAGGSAVVKVWDYPRGDWGESDVVRRDSIHVQSDHAVSVHGLNYMVETTDGFLALPTGLLGTNYLVLSYRNSPAWWDESVVIGGTEFGVVATADGTHVDITPSIDTPRARAGETFRIELQQGENYQLIDSSDAAADFTGTAVVSDKPVAVFAGNRGALVPAGVPAADHVVEQMPPVHLWGRHFVSMPLAGRAGGDTFRLLAMTNGTQVSVNGVVAAELNRGEFYEAILDGPAEIRSGEPILVAQFANGSKFDETAGDPFMTLLPPVERFGADYVLTTPGHIWNAYQLEFQDIYTNYLNVIVPVGAAGRIEVDGEMVPSDRYRVFGDLAWAGVQWPVSPGAHRIRGPVAFGVEVYGWADYESYAFPGAIYSDRDETIGGVELSQETRFAEVGGEKTVMATVRTASGGAAPDVQVTFQVSGANPGTGQGITSQFGEVFYTWRGARAGVDVIRASVGDARCQSTNTWLAAGGNQAPAVSIARTRTVQVGWSVALDGEVSDDGLPGLGAVRSRWRLLSGPADAAIADPSQPVTTATVTAAGVYEFELAASDSELASRAVVRVTVVGPFSVDLSGIESGSWIFAGTPVIFRAAVAMEQGNWTNLAFFDGDSLVGEGLDNSLEIDSWTVGEHSITAVATESHGIQTRSNPLEIFVTAPPQIEVLEPLTDRVLPFGEATGTIRARAREEGGGVTNLSVWLNGWELAETAGETLEFNGSFSAGGEFQGKYGTSRLRFVATDAHGLSVETWGPQVTLLPPAMQVEITSPAEGQVCYVGQAVPLRAAAAVESPASIAWVGWQRQVWPYPWAWYWAWLSWPPAETAPFEADWTPTAAGDYRFMAVAESGCYTQTNSAVRMVHVLPARIPNLSIQSIPVQPTNVWTGMPILLAGFIDDTNVDAVRQVEFFADGESIGVCTHLPWLTTYAPAAPGLHQVSARLTTTFGATADSPVYGLTSVPVLDISWENVRDGDWVAVGTNRSIGVRVSDPGGVLDHIEFRVNDTELQDGVSAFASWTPTTAGDCALSARAWDRFGNSHDAGPITVHAETLQPPEVRIVEPSPLARFGPGEPVRFVVEAIEHGRPVTDLSLARFSQPEISIGGKRLEFWWTNLPSGELRFTAMAMDDRQQEARSEVRIVVDLPVDVSLSAPAGLRVTGLGCCAARVEWDTNGLPAEARVVVERQDGGVGAWRVAGRAAGEKGRFQDNDVRGPGRFLYRTYLKTRVGARSPDSGTVGLALRSFAAGGAVLDLAEMLDEAGAFASSKATMGGLSKFCANNNRRSAKDWRVRLVSERGSGQGQLADLNAFFSLGISDLNSVLLSGGFAKDEIWSPGNVYEAIADANFYPFRMTSTGLPVGTLYSEVATGGSTVVTQCHAGFWQGGFVDLTPDVTALHEPSSLPALRIPYSTYDSVADINVVGDVVGIATWVPVTSWDGGRTSLPLLDPMRKATLWPCNGGPAVNFGALQSVRNESGFQAINASGEIVGFSSLRDEAWPEAAVTHAVRSHTAYAAVDGDKLTDLGTLGGLYSAALAINASGLAVGYSTRVPEDAITNARAVYWDRGDTVPTELPGYSPEFFSYARAVDDAGQIAGEAVDFSGRQQAVLWRPAIGLDGQPGFELCNLNDRIRRSDWQLTSARGINRNGFIVGQGLHSAMVSIDGGLPQPAVVPRAFLLIPDVCLAVDFNRDGRITLDGDDDLPEGQPYQFWVNDDVDNGDLTADDVPGAQVNLMESGKRFPNFADDSVNGTSDLEDWFPVYLGISNLLAVLPSPQFEYRLSQADGAVNFLYTDLGPENAGSYLTNLSATGFGDGFNQPAAGALGVHRVWGGMALSAAFLEKAASGGGVLLMEACNETVQPLRLEVWKGSRLVTSIELPLRITGVEDMYGWVNLRDVAGGPVVRATQMRPSNAPVFDREHQAFVFVHGYNVNEQQSRGWAAEMFKRLWWSGSSRPFWAVSWFGDDSQAWSYTTVNYHTNVVHAFQTAPTLGHFLNRWLWDCDQVVAAHSLGNMMVCAAIQDFEAAPDRFFMIDAALPIEAFDASLVTGMEMVHPDWKEYSERLYASEWFRLFPHGDGRRGLTWRGRFQDVPGRTELYNFYSSGEEVLENRRADSDPWIFGLLAVQWHLGVSPVSTLAGEQAWELQELLKGRMTPYHVSWILTSIPWIGRGVDWVKGEFLGELEKGRLLGSYYAGWGFNPKWETPGTTYPVQLENGTQVVYIPGAPFAPEVMAETPDQGLMDKPFFLPFLDERLTTPPGSDLAADPLNRACLLAGAIPARSFAVGANGVKEMKHTVQFDMPAEFQHNGWPDSRVRNVLTRLRWFHSDLRDVAYVHTYLLFNSFVTEGNK
ncbi:MAG: Ig-like domain-containing protein [Verrucomicrobiota bacterium]